MKVIKARGLCMRAVQHASRVCGQGVVHQGGFARTRHAGHAGEQANGKHGVNAVQVVAACTFDAQALVGVVALAQRGQGRLNQTAKSIFHRRLLHRLAGPGEPRPGGAGRFNAALAAEVKAGERVRVAHQLVGCALRRDAPAVHACARAHVDAVFGGANHVFVMFHHDHAVAQVAQPLQGGNEAVVVALMQANAGLVEHIHHPRQARANL